MATPRRAELRSTELRTAGEASATAAVRLFGAADLDDPVASWRTLGPPLAATVEAGQRAAVGGARSYVEDVQVVTAPDATRAARVAVDGLVGTAADGRDLDALLYRPFATATRAVRLGASPLDARRLGATSLHRIVKTTVSDTGRAAERLELAAFRTSGYVRQVEYPARSRCIVLAGKWFRWNRGFERHPECDCVHVPAREDVAGDFTTDPRAAFDALDAAEQERVFTPAGAEAIRAGADPAQVVNARRGAAGLAPSFGRLTAEEVTSLRDGLQRGRLSTVTLYGHPAPETLALLGATGARVLRTDRDGDVAVAGNGAALRTLVRGSDPADAERRARHTAG
ncbi:hypothetical protein [Kineococcus terrestris]|uniref:hypothetical protein n=1 Tax=Kineococcus terrestris TaxID=2044856 RepID=UPI0034DB2E81